ncbi:MAG: Rne/Rng family ribonuclease, partial [Planctomycetota bacterium]
VGHKTPRRQRPPIQQALKKGQEVVVQVIKEGIGSKGPTLTSYISIPGRYLVMMPDMDRVGVSRRVEDDELRRKMRQILDQLDLPEGFGFILRTAGLDRTKTELKRDLAYLQRLWKDMERRRAAGNKPRLLYAESDLLVRALRDVLGPDIKDVVIDDEQALRRAARFIKIVAPRSGVTLRKYEGPWPLFTAFGVEEQLRAALQREVPLPSGGSLVIDETEALVAIDVNSGKMRRHGDAETTAYETNCEAVEEICRQLRLRDLGGVVILDLIDMRSRQRRRDIEKRLREALKRDRARWEMLPISEFGIVELTRQRMRGSLRSGHFAPCPVCEGRGQVKKPDSVAADALRDLTGLLHHDRVRRVEFVVSPPVAGALLSRKRAALSRLEQRTGKRLDVRVSETIDVDRVIFYAYDERGADVDVSRLPKPHPPAELPEWTEPARTESEWAADVLEEQQEPPGEDVSGAQEPSAAGEAEETLIQEPDILVSPLFDETEEIDEAADAATEPAAEESAAEKRRKRRRRRRRKRTTVSDSAAARRDEAADRATAPAAHPAAPPEREQTEQTAETDAEQEQPSAGVRKRRRRRRSRRPDDAPAAPPHTEAQRAEAAQAAEPADPQTSTGAAAASEKPRSKKRSRRKKRAASTTAQTNQRSAAADREQASPATALALVDEGGEEASAQSPAADEARRPRPTRSRRKKKPAANTSNAAPSPTAPSAEAATPSSVNGAVEAAEAAEAADDAASPAASSRQKRPRRAKRSRKAAPAPASASSSEDPSPKA